MAIDAGNNSPTSRSYFQKSVSLHDWWLTKSQTNDDTKRIGVSGLTGASQVSRAERCFTSAPILKAHDFFELETVDGVCVNLQGYINKEKTLESGFSSEVFDHFVIGFPPYWEEFSTSCPERGSSDECVSIAHEEDKDSIEGHRISHDMNTEDKVLSNKASGVSLDTPQEPTMKVGDEKPPLASEFEDVAGKGPLLKDLECSGSRRMTRSMTKVDSSRNHGAQGSLSNLDRVTFVDPENLDISRKDKDDASKGEQNYQYVAEDQRNKSTSQVSTFDQRESLNELQIDSMRSDLDTKRFKAESSDPLRKTSMKGSKKTNKKRDTTGGTDVSGKESTSQVGTFDQRESLNELQIDSMRSDLETKRLKSESSDPLRKTSMKGSKKTNKKRDTTGGADVSGKEGTVARKGIASMTQCKSKKKLTFESSPCEMAKRQQTTSPKSTSTPILKVSTERHVNANVLSPESISGKRSRSGRILLPSLQFWRNQTVVYAAGLVILLDLTTLCLLTMYVHY